MCHDFWTGRTLQPMVYKYINDKHMVLLRGGVLNHDFEFLLVRVGFFRVFYCASNRHRIPLSFSNFFHTSHPCTMRLQYARWFASC